MKKKNKKRKSKFGLFIKIVLIIVLLLVVIAGVAVVVVEGVPRWRGVEEVGDTSDSVKWMSKIDDSTSLTDVTIPGAHDACAKNVKLAAFGKCQEQDIPTILKQGYRYLDIRIGCKKTDEGYKLGLYHGFVECMTGNGFFDEALKVEDVLKDCESFLINNPTETILFVVKKETEDCTISEFEKTLSSYINRNTKAESWLFTDTIPTMGEARGKIILCRRYEDEAKLGVKSGLPLIWDEQDNKEIATVPYEKTTGNSVLCFIQDHYKYDTTNKWNTFADVLNKSYDLLKQGPVINFLSTNGTWKYGFPESHAKDLNEQLIRECAGKTMKGWIIVDYCNTRVSKTIYQTNWVVL